MPSGTLSERISPESFVVGFVALLESATTRINWPGSVEGLGLYRSITVGVGLFFLVKIALFFNAAVLIDVIRPRYPRIAHVAMRAFILTYVIIWAVSYSLGKLEK